MFVILNKTEYNLNSKKFVVRFRFYWRPPEGFHFHWRGLKSQFFKFKTLHMMIYNPLEGIIDLSRELIIPLEGFRYLSRGFIISLEGFRYLFRWFNIPLKGFINYKL